MSLNSGKVCKKYCQFHTRLLNNALDKFTRGRREDIMKIFDLPPQKSNQKDGVQAKNEVFKL